MSITTLYRFYDADDVLLYVGISERGPERWKAHRKGKPWWTDVARTTTEHYDTRQQALDAERAAIVAEKPLHNVVHNRSTPATPKRKPEAVGSLRFPCMWCSAPINPGEGYVWIDHPHGCNDWIATHRQCDPDIDRTGYWIAVERIASPTDYLHWLSHLEHKRWFDQSSFDRALNGTAIFRRIEYCSNCGGLRATYSYGGIVDGWALCRNCGHTERVPDPEIAKRRVMGVK